MKTDDVAGNLIADYESRLVHEPRNLKLVRSVAELYAQKKDYDKSLEYYERIRASEQGADASLEKAISEIVLKRFDQLLSQLDAANPDHAAQIEQIKGERAGFQLDEIKKRKAGYGGRVKMARKAPY